MLAELLLPILVSEVCEGVREYLAHLRDREQTKRIEDCEERLESVEKQIRALKRKPTRSNGLRKQKS